MATNVPSVTWGDTGFVIPALSDVLDGALADINAAFGGALSTDLRTPQGQLATSISAMVDYGYQMFQYYAQQVDPSYASGRMQDAIGRIYFMTRIAATATTVTCTCTGLAGTVIPAGAIVQDDSGHQFTSSADAEIGTSGTVSVVFTCTETGPIIVAADTVTTIYQAISGWDSVTNPSAGVTGSAVETRAEFEARRSASVASNSVGSVPAVLGSVLSVDGVTSAYVLDNPTASSVTTGGVTLAPHSLYVAAYGGTDSDVATAIWKKKSPGCAYNGNTTVTVYDTSSGYMNSAPSYDVTFTRPTDVGIVFDVVIKYSTSVPSDYESQIEQAIVAAFSGTDDVDAATIGGTIYPAQYYTTISGVGTWAKIISVKVGSINSPSAVFTASASAGTLTVSAVASGAISVGDVLFSDSLASGTKITALGTGTGGTGTYTIDDTSTVASESMTAVTANLFEVGVNIDQIPVTSAALISVRTSS